MLIWILFAFATLPDCHCSSFIDSIVQYQDDVLLVWGEWSSWSDCSVSCGVGTQNRSRSCVSPDLYLDSNCTDGLVIVDIKQCNGTRCGGDLFTEKTYPWIIALICIAIFALSVTLLATAFEFIKAIIKWKNQRLGHRNRPLFQIHVVDGDEDDNISEISSSNDSWRCLSSHHNH